MTLLEAIDAASNGSTIVSCAGKRYTPQMLAPIWTCGQCASYATAGMAEKERKGAWSLDAEYIGR